MRRTVAPTMLLVAGLMMGAGSAGTVRAQSPAPAAAKAGSAKLVASWSGTYATDGPSGPMTLAITREGDTWKIETTLESAPPAGEVREIVADGDKITWKQVFGEYDVAFVATLSADGSQLTGTLDATQGGSSVGGGTFTLTK